MEERSSSNASSPSLPPPTHDVPLVQQNGNSGDVSSSLVEGVQPTEKNVTKTQSTKSKALSNPWLLEWCALACCISSFAGLIIMLAHFDDRLLSEWKWNAVSINTVTSVLAAISKTTLVMAISACIAQFKWNWFREEEGPLIDFDRFDDASKGPWGSFRLIKTMIRRPHWILLGAIATIVLPTYDPFLQALINLENVGFVKAGVDGWVQLNDAKQANGSIQTSSSASIGRCLDLDVGSYIEQGAGAQGAVAFNGSDGKLMSTTYFTYDLRTDFGMMAAIWNGLSGLVRPTNLWPEFVCSSGNCTWDAYASLAVCSKCNDLSKDLVKESGVAKWIGNWSLDGTQLLMGPDAKLPEITYQWLQGFLDPNATFTKYTLKGSGLNMSNYDGVSRCNPADQFCPDTYMTASVTTNPGLTLTFQDLESLIISIQMIKANDSWKKNKTLWQNTPVVAQECSLWFCVAAYDSKVSNGKLEETMQTWANRSPNSFQSTDVTSDIDMAYTKSANYSLDLPGNVRTDLQLYLPSEVMPQVQSPRKFNVSQSTIAGMIKVFSGELETSSHALTNNTFPPIIYPAVGWINPPDFIQSLADSDANTTFGRLSSSISKWMRDQASASSAVTGYATQTMVVIKIQWPYLILPSITLLAGLFVTILAITDTRKMKLPVWKGDAIVLLGHGIESNLYQKLNSTTTRDEAYYTAREERVVLKEDDGQWKLGMSNDRIEI